MPDKIDTPAKQVARTDNTLGIDDLSTQPSSVEKSPDAKLPIEFGRYRLLKQLGEGGMGVVYLAHDIELDRQVALKLPHFSGAKSKDLAERFRREARLAATLDHPNICRIYDIGEHRRRLFLTMAFVEGKSLHEIIRSKGAIEPLTAVALLRRIAQAVHFAHGRGVIHRDLKPANIMIKKDRDFVIMDFGLARRVDQEEAQLTATGAVLGTPAYMAPEQLRGEKGASGPQSDVYSLGIILYELLTGQRPFQGTLPQIYAQVLTTDSVSPSMVRAGIDPALDAICQKATNRDAGQRYQSAEEFASALGQYLSASNSVGPALAPVRSQQPKLAFSPETRASLPPRRRNPTMLIAVGGAAFFAVLLGVIVVLVRNKDGTTTELRLPDGALAVEVQKDDRTIVTVDVADEAQLQASEGTDRSSDKTQISAIELPNTNMGGLSETQAIRLLHSNWSLHFEGANGTRFIVNPPDRILENKGKLVSIRADERQEFPADYVKSIFLPCIAALPMLTAIEGTSQFNYTEQEFMDLAKTPFAAHGTIISCSYIPLTEAVAESLKNSFHKIEFVKLLVDRAGEGELQAIASMKCLRSVWFQGLSVLNGPEVVDTIAQMNLDFMGLYQARKFTQNELVSLGDSIAREIWFHTCDFDDSDLAIFASHSQAELLRFGWTKVTDEGLLQLQLMKSLKQVDLRNTSYDLSAIQALAKLRPDISIYWSGGTVTGSEKTEADPHGFQELKIVAKQVDGCDLKISAGGIEVLGLKNSDPQLTINGLAWQPKDKRTLVSQGEMSFLNGYLDFSRARVHVHHVPNGGSLAYAYYTDHVRLKLVGWGNSEHDHELSLQIPTGKTDWENVDTLPMWEGPWDVTGWEYPASWWGEMPTEVPPKEKKPFGSGEFQYVDWDWWDTAFPFPTTPTDHFVLIGERKFRSDGGVYRIETLSKEGIRIMLDGQVVIDSWLLQDVTQNARSLEIPSGLHTLRFEYANANQRSRIAVNLRCDEPRGNELTRKVAELPMEQLVARKAIDNLRALGAYVDEEINSPVPLVSEVIFSVAPHTVQNSVMSTLHSLPGLKSLEFGANEFTPRTWSELSYLPQLRKLGLTYGAIDEEDLKEISKLKSLESLGILGNDVNDEKLKIISTMSQLRSLDCWYAPLTDASIDTLVNMPELRQVNFGGTQLTDVGIEKLMRARPDIKVYPGLKVRMIWIPQNEEVNSIFVHQADGTWQEQTLAGDGNRFEESERSDQYIELFDAARNLRIRFFDDHAEMGNGDAQYTGWKKGGWSDPLQVPNGFRSAATVNK